METPHVALGSVIRLRKEFFEIDDLQSYKRCRVQLHAAGVVLRDEIPGSLIKTKRQQKCKAGDFLVAEIDAKHGGYGIVPDQLEGAVVSSHYFLFEINETVIDRGYLALFLKTQEFLDQVVAQGSTNYAAIRPTHVLEYTIPLPTLAEQQRIVARVDEITTKLSEAYLLHNQVSWNIPRLLSGFIDARFAEIEDAWPRASIAELGGWVTSGPRGWGDFYDPNGKRRLVRVENVTNLNLNLSKAVRVAVPPTAGDLERSRVRKGDVLVTITGAIGRVGVVEKFDLPCHVSQHVAIIRLSEKINSYYLFWFLQSSVFGLVQTEGQTYGATKPGIGLNSLRRLQVPVPNLETQLKVVARLNEFQNNIRIVQVMINKITQVLDALLPAILNQAFQGSL